MKKTTKLTSILALSTALTFTAVGPSHALFGSGFSSAGIIAAVNKVRDGLLGGFNTLNLTNTMGFGQMTQNSQAEIAAEARMREAEQSLDLMRRIDEQKIKARDQSANTRMDCVIETRSRYIQGEVQSDTILSQSTKDALQKFAAIKMGMNVGASGTPKVTETPEEKAATIVASVDAMMTNPAGPGNGALLASQSILMDPSSVTDANRELVNEACNAFAQISDGSVRDNIAWLSSSKEADSATKKIGLYADQMRSSLAQTILLNACIRNDPQAFRESAPELHNLYMARTNDVAALSGLGDGGVSLNEARKIRGWEWSLTKEEMDNLPGGEVGYLKALLSATGSANVQNYELQETLEKTNLLLSGVLLSVNEQASLMREFLDK